MKKYVVHLTGNRTAIVEADSHMPVEDRLLFYRDGSPIADVYFLLSAVEGVSVAPEYEDDVAG